MAEIANLRNEVDAITRILNTVREVYAIRTEVDAIKRELTTIKDKHHQSKQTNTPTPSANSNYGTDKADVPSKPTAVIAKPSDATVKPSAAPATATTPTKPAATTPATTSTTVTATLAAKPAAATAAVAVTATPAAATATTTAQSKPAAITTTVPTKPAATVATKPTTSVTTTTVSPAPKPSGVVAKPVAGKPAAAGQQNVLSPAQQSIVDKMKSKSAADKSIDATKLETYLSDEEFAIVFEQSKSEYQKLPKWKQEAKKKSVGMF
jgi:hypothetical protein